MHQWHTHGRPQHGSKWGTWPPEKVHDAQLCCSCRSSRFLVCLVVIILTCSPLLEPVTQALQAIRMNLLSLHKHIWNWIDIFLCRRQDFESYFNEDIFANGVAVTHFLNTEMNVPRQCERSEHLPTSIIVTDK